jgi:hypothetical protein
LISAVLGRIRLTTILALLAGSLALPVAANARPMEACSVLCRGEGWCKAACEEGAEVGWLTSFHFDRDHCLAACIEGARSDSEEKCAALSSATDRIECDLAEHILGLACARACADDP